MKKFKETGSAELERDHYFNREEPDLDIPDGDIVKGARLFRAHCASCHDMTLTTQAGPAIGTVYGRLAANTNYNYSTSMGGSRRQFRWSKPRLYIFLQDPEAMFRETNMTFDGLKSSFERACIIEYLHSLKSHKLKV